jgi:hypothetical protein
MRRGGDGNTVPDCNKFGNADEHTGYAHEYSNGNGDCNRNGDKHSDANGNRNGYGNSH